jgi:carboxylesterase
MARASRSRPSAEVIERFAAVFAGEEHQPFHLDAGSGSPAALLVHGFPGTPAEMRPLGEALHAAGWTAHGVLLPGFGAQIASLGEKRLEDWALHVHTALDALKRRHDLVIIVGWSMGGALSLHAAAELQPAGAALLSPFWKIDHVLWKTLPVLRYAVPSFRPFSLIRLDFDDPETRKGMRAMMPDADLDDPAVQAVVRDFAIPTSVLDQLRRVGKTAEAAAPYLRCPALIVQGRRDDLVKPHLTRMLSKRISSLERCLEVDAEHNLPDASQPAWGTVCAAVLEFAQGRRVAKQGGRS